ncbi:acyltransferase [Colletotrichum truncatum]|uniref:Acyltransferase n=1 Tax=Colletotrichum truncatum TaxID=5467 RepID=A0ACC3YWQ7_COLTU|nr:acyltransferase [Colletotrichum truncatum]KAF6787547.1 acyltransferase [Colletotrichum truncatum]
MPKGFKLGLWARNVYEESLDTVRSWIFVDQSGDAHLALLSNEERGTSEHLPTHEPKPLHRRRKCRIGWKPKDALRLLWAVVPSFIANACGHGESLVPPANETSYLNGLRGIASLIVAIQHNTNDYKYIYRGWGETELDRFFMQLPFIRLVFCGSFMVAVFFVISGFALTYGPLKKSHNGKADAAIASLPSSIFRRPFRLFLPVIPVLIITVALIQIQWFYQGNATLPPLVGGFWAQVYFIWATFLLILTAGTIKTIMPQAWTLSTEFAGSLLVFMCCMAFARASPVVRIPFVFMLLSFFFYFGMWPQILFLAGMILADVRHTRKKIPGLKGAMRWIATIMWSCLLVLALFLGGWPMLGNGYAAAGYSWFVWVPTSGMKPDRFFTSMSAIALVASLEYLPLLQRIFNVRAILYLGEISYGLYLVHWTASSIWLTYGVKLRLLEAGCRHEVAWSIGFAFSVVLCIWAGDVHWRLIDRKAVSFARWLSDKCGI